jgi:hypothetical protein
VGFVVAWELLWKEGVDCLFVGRFVYVRKSDEGEQFPWEIRCI